MNQQTNPIMYQQGQQQANPIINQQGQQQANPMIYQQANPMMYQQGQQQTNPMMYQQGQQQANPIMYQQGQQQANPMMYQQGQQQANPMMYQQGHQQANPMMFNPMMFNPMMNPMMVNPMMMNPMANPMINQQTPQPITTPNIVNKEYQPINRHEPIILAQPAIVHNDINMQEQGGNIDVPIHNQEQQLINQFDNITLSKSKKNKKTDINFKQWNDGRNIIKHINPVNINDSHFNNKTHPNEKYIVTFINDNKEELIAFDINEYALDSHKTIYEHNKNINQEDIKGYTIIYTRTSSPNCISHKTQLNECLKYATTQNFILTGYYCDNGISGRHGNNLKNGELGFWTKYINNGTHFIIYSVDRLTRHLLSGITYIDNLVTKNIDIHFVTNNIVYNTNISAMHKSMIQQEFQTAEKYSNEISYKIKGTLNRLRAEGHCTGGRIPYGVKRIVVDGIRKQISNVNEINNIKLVKNKYYDICQNFNNYKNFITFKTNIRIYNYLAIWCEEQNIKHRNNKNLTINQIRKFIVTKV